MPLGEEGNSERPDEVADLESLSDERPSYDATCLQEPFAAAVVGHYRSIPFPAVVVDSAFRLIWFNESFLAAFSETQPQLGTPLPALFMASLGEKRSAELYRGARSPETSFCWRGRVESGGKLQPTILANLLITPLPTHKEGLPTGYLGIFDVVTGEVRAIMRGTFESLLEASRLKDDDTGKHVERVNEYSQTLAEQLYGRPSHAEVDREFVEDIGFLAAMHDVGKIGVADDILHKAGPLTEAEWAVMKQHTINGAYILSTYPKPMARQIALFHHEWWNGKGYPYGVTAEMIPLSARIVAVADVYDALRMRRSYKPAFSHEKARSELLAGSGSHFDPKLIELFSGVEARFEDIFKKWGDPTK